MALVDKFFRLIPLPYPLVAFITSVGIYSGFLMFSAASGYDMQLTDHLIAVSMGLLIGYQMGAISYLLSIFRKLLCDLDEVTKDENINIYKEIYNGLFVSYWRYAFMLCIVLPFYIVDWIPPSYQNIYESFFSFSATHSSIWAIPFDIFMDAVALLAEILLSLMLWIMLSMTYSLRYVENAGTGSDMNLDAQRIKLKMYSIRSLLSTAIILCIISISLAIFSYIDPFQFYTTEVGMLLILMLMSLILYLSAIEATQQILRNRVIYEIDCISKKSQEQVQRLMLMPSAWGNEDEISKVSQISNMIDVLQKQREKLEGIFPQKYSIKSISITIITLGGSFLISLVSGLSRIIIEKNPDIISQINDVIIKIVSNLFSSLRLK